MSDVSQSNDPFPPDLGSSESRLQDTRTGVQRPEPFIHSRNDRPYSQWGTPDFALAGAQNYPGVSPGPMMPQANDFPGLIHGATMMLGRFGSRYSGMPAIAMGTYANAFWNAYNAGMRERAQTNWQQYQRARQMTIDRQQEENRAYAEVYAAYHDEDGKITDTDAFAQGLRGVASKYHDNTVLNALSNGQFGMIDRILGARDGVVSNLQKAAHQEERQRLDDESKRIELEIRKGELKRQQDEDAASKRFLEPGSSQGQQGPRGSPPAPSSSAIPGMPQLSSVSDGVNHAAQQAQMGDKSVDIPKTAAAAQAVNARKNELDNYMRGLTDPKSQIPPDQILPLVRQANPAMADLVQDLLDGTSQPNMAESTKEPGRTAVNLAKKIDPNFVRNAEVRKEQLAQKGQTAQISILRNDLINQQKIYDRMRSTLGKNIADMDYLMQLAKDMHRGGIETGSPVIDRWIRAGRRDVLGDPEVSKFMTQLELFRSDAGTLLRTNQGSGVYTIYAQREMEKLLQPGMTLSQLQATMDVFKRDYDFRMRPMIKVINDLQTRLGKIAGIPPDLLPDDPLQGLNLPPSGAPVPTNVPPMPSYREIK